MRSRTLHITIRCAPAKVYGFVAEPRNLPKWATTFVRSIQRSSGRWVAQTPQGPVVIRITGKNRFGILDHTVTPPKALPVFVPMRVVPNGTGSEVLFTLFRSPGMSVANFRKDAQLVKKDLKSLKNLLEEQYNGSTTP